MSKWTESQSEAFSRRNRIMKTSSCSVSKWITWRHIPKKSQRKEKLDIMTILKNYCKIIPKSSVQSSFYFLNHSSNQNILMCSLITLMLQRWNTSFCSQGPNRLFLRCFSNIKRRFFFRSLTRSLLFDEKKKLLKVRPIHPQFVKVLT